MFGIFRPLLVRYAPAPLKRLARRGQRQFHYLRHGRPVPSCLFAFGGRTATWPELGHELYARDPVFRATVDACELFTTQELHGPSLLAQFTGEAGPDFFSDEPRLMHGSVVLQLALVDMWRARGVQPDAALGTSLGEIAAVYACGGLSLPDALRVSACGYAIGQRTTPTHGVLLVPSSEATLAALLPGSPVELSLLLVREAASCLLLCRFDELAQGHAYLSAHGLSSQVLSDTAIRPYHSLLPTHLTAMRRPLAGLQPLPLARACYLATRGGRVAAGTVLSADYWLAVFQHAVQLHSTLASALADGNRLLLPIGSNPFPFYSEEELAAQLGSVQLLPALQAGQSEWAVVEENFAQLQRQRVTGAPEMPRREMTPAEFTAQFQLLDPGFTNDLNPGFAYLQRQGPLHFLAAENGWLVVDSDLINEVMREPLVYSSNPTAPIDNQLAGADPPLHTETRTLIQSYFSPKRLGALAEFANDGIVELGATLLARGSFDFVHDLALPLTQAMSGELLGLTPAERQELGSRLPSQLYEFEYFKELTTFFQAHFEQRQTSAEPVLLDRLLAHWRAGRCSLAEIVNLSITIWLAGLSTTGMLMSSAAYHLLAHPQVAEQLRADPALVPAFVEEMLRLETPLHTLPRRTTQPVVLGGQALPADTLVLCCVAAANRDPRRFSAPDVLDLQRKPARHLAFGGGIHACIGAHLARLETRLMVQWLLAQGPRLRLANARALPEFRPSQIMRVLQQLPLLASSVPAAPHD
ncbi:cytochrome P450 [Hymenobacter negativus]|uniref:Cytochrome P450 n=1 Tax=Hymenobacter negativus TaxID=2795026 RepID=A0ABS0QBG9_9BACT|nr:cytochrome P450 [Hymenobacter negativus]MBH8560008.1 cytochrome P450 [Hymenobacter negativus]